MVIKNNLFFYWFINKYHFEKLTFQNKNVFTNAIWYVKYANLMYHKAKRNKTTCTIVIFVIKKL